MAQHSASNSSGTPFIELQTVDSTNKYAMELAHDGMAQHGMAIFAHEQTAGKGQRGKGWIAEAGANIILSVIIRPERLKLADQFYFNAAVSLAVFSFFSKYAGDETKIKWPNDLYWRDRKAGGILIESVVGGQSVKTGSQSTGSGGNSDEDKWKWAVIGAGININQTIFPAALSNPVSLKQITGKSFDSILLAKELCGYLNDSLQNLFSGNRDEILKQYNQHLYKLNEKVKLKKDNRVFEIIIKGVSSSGKLLTESVTDDSLPATGFDFGEVEWVI